LKFRSTRVSEISLASIRQWVTVSVRYDRNEVETEAKTPPENPPPWLWLRWSPPEGLHKAVSDEFSDDSADFSEP